jgi:serine/threonine-protein kinase
MLELRSGSLHLEGFDILLPRQSAPSPGGWAAFSVAAATDLSLTNCTVTIEGEAPRSAVVVLGAARKESPSARGVDFEPTSATVRVTDSLLRGGGDIFDVSGGRRVVMEVNNAVISSGGSLIHAHGSPRGQAPERVSVTIRQVTARNEGGLLHIDSTSGEPELPLAEVVARDSILATEGAESPLLRVDGQDSVTSISDRITWEGHGNAYARLVTYRRDQSTRLGAAPVLYDRHDWTVWAGLKDASPFHGDARFVRDWEPGREPWLLVPENARLADDSPVLSAGSDLERIPNPPAS